MTGIIAITETMEQVHKHCATYLALHRELVDTDQVFKQAIRERWGDTDPAALLVSAELNSLDAERAKLIRNPKKNPWVSTIAQGDLFNDVPVLIPAVLIKDGKPTPYYECSIVDGLEYWRARQDHRAEEAARYREAAAVRSEESSEAAAQAEHLESLIQRALDAGLNPNKVTYARAQA